MPERIIRPSILTSDRVATLSWAAEVLFRRLMSVVDDYGRYDGRPAILRAALYPLQLAKVSDSDVGKWRLETAEAGLVRVYCHGGREYVEIQDFRQRMRAAKSKFPAPEEGPGDAGGGHQRGASIGRGGGPPSSAGMGGHPHANASETETETDAESESESESESDTEPDAEPEAKARAMAPVKVAQAPGPESPAGGGDSPPLSEALATLHEVKQWAQRVMVPEHCAEVWWHEMEGVGWVDTKGRPVRKALAAFTAFAVRWNANEHRSGGRKGSATTVPPQGGKGWREMNGSGEDPGAF